MLGAAAALLAMLAGGLLAGLSSARRCSRRARIDETADVCSARLRKLRGAIVGADKQTIAAALGAPQATLGRGDYRSDDTWYYPLDPPRKLALAIEFDAGIARDTCVLVGPR